MWEQIGAGAVYGAIGGAAGAVLGALLAAPLKDTALGKWITPVLTVGFVLLGANFAEPLLKPYIGQYLPADRAASEFDIQFDKMMSELSADPLFTAILEREPDLRNELRDDLKSITIEAATPASAQSLAFSTSYNKVLGRLIYYTKRGRDEDLVAFFAAVTDGLEILSRNDARFCYDYLYNPAALTSLTIDDIRSLFGEEQFNRQQELGGRLVKNAYDEIPDYNVEIGVAGVQRAATVLQNLLGEEFIGLVAGTRRPKNDEEAQLACDATSAMYRNMLAEEHSADVLRHLFAGSG